jgi:hypothetical protein
MGDIVKAIRSHRTSTAIVALAATAWVGAVAYVASTPPGLPGTLKAVLTPIINIITGWL